MMTAEVYISGVKQNYELGDKPGLRVKYTGEDWEPARFEVPPTPPHARQARERSSQGYKIARAQFPEGVAVWNEKAFARARDFLFLSGFLTVKQKFADVLNRFDLGGGELVPVPLFKADLTTPWPEPYYYINYGGSKDTLLARGSRNLRLMYENAETGASLYSTHAAFGDADMALSQQAKDGADIGIERRVHSKLFLSGALVDALLAAKINVDLELKTCRIVEG